MKILLKIFIGIVVFLILVVVVSFCLPSKSHVERSIVINADPEIVFNQVNTLKNWEQWSPWYKMEPDMKLTYNDIPSGRGASYSWAGKKTGEGTLTISDCKQNETVVTMLDFKGQGQSTGGFTIAPNAGGTDVVWYMDMTPGMNEYFEEGETQHDRGKYQWQRRQRIEHAAARHAPRDAPAGDGSERGDKRRRGRAEHEAVDDRAPERL